jgi:hypothetical protein
MSGQQLLAIALFRWSVMDSSPQSSQVSQEFLDVEPAQGGIERLELDGTSAPKSRMISKVVAPALRLWLRSQVEHVEDLEVQIDAGDRKILSGQIQRVYIAARKAIYQGLHLSQLRLMGENIRVNLGQVLRGKPLTLLEPVPVRGELQLAEADLNASLQAPLLANAIAEFLVSLLAGEIQAVVESPLPGHQALNLDQAQIKITEGHLTLSALLMATDGNTTPIFIRTGLELLNGQALQLNNPQWLTRMNAQRGLPLGDLDGFAIDLGSDVALEELTLTDGALICRGRIQVIP